MIKKIILCIFLLTFSSPIYSTTPSLKDFTINKKNKIYAKRNISYFIKQGYELVLQETRGVRTAYVLQKDNDYLGCRTETLSKVETCYVMVLTKTE
jgi:hypothetical protein